MTAPARIKQSESVLSRTVGAEVLLSMPDREGIDLLSGPAATIWHLLVVPRSRGEIPALLEETYGPSEDSMDENVGGLLSDLSERGYLEKLEDGDG